MKGAEEGVEPWLIDVVIKVVGLVKGTEEGAMADVLLSLLVWCKGSRRWRVWSHG